MQVTRWDLRVAAQAALLAGIGLTVTWLVTAASDEGALGWGTRAGRTLPLTPLAAAVGAWGALARVRTRGEGTALAALGQAPPRTAAAAVAGGAVVGLLASLLIGTVPAVDVSGFYPVATRNAAWQWHDGAFEDAMQGLRVDANGAIVRLTPAPGSGLQRIPPGGRLAAALATALATLALAALAGRAALGSAATRRRIVAPRVAPRATPRVTIRRTSVGLQLGSQAVVAVGFGAVSVVLFQAAAAGRIGALWAVVPGGLLLAFAAERYRAES